MLMEPISCNVLFRWFVGLAMDDVVLDQSKFNKNRDRLLEHDGIAGRFNETVEAADVSGYLSGKHFSADGTHDSCVGWMGTLAAVRCLREHLSCSVAFGRNAGLRYLHVDH